MGFSAPGKLMLVEARHPGTMGATAHSSHFELVKSIIDSGSIVEHGPATRYSLQQAEAVQKIIAHCQAVLANINEVEARRKGEERERAKADALLILADYKRLTANGEDWQYTVSPMQTGTLPLNERNKITRFAHELCVEGLAEREKKTGWHIITITDAGKQLAAKVKKQREECDWICT